MSTSHRNAPPNLDPGVPGPNEHPDDLHPRLGGDAVEGGAAGHPTSGLTGDGGGLGDALARGELMSDIEAQRDNKATPAIGTGPGTTVAGGALVREAEHEHESGDERKNDRS
jgi:hypothetical protein